MIINYMSDLHLEFQDAENRFKLTNPQNADVLILAGDITTKMDTTWIEEVAKLYPDVIYIMGNHEYYYGELPDTRIKTQEKLKNSNIHVLENSSVSIYGVNFHGCTLWTDCGDGDPGIVRDIQRGMNDFRFIRNPGGLFSAADMLLLHNHALDWLEYVVKPGDVVITHHAPSFKSMAPEYKNSQLNFGFMSDLDLVLQELKPSLWFHGHVHNSFDYTISDTRVLCNPRGYMFDTVVENPDFNPDMLVAIQSEINDIDDWLGKTLDELF